MLTVERLKEVLEYNPDSGLWVWIRRDNNKCRPGKIAGTLDKQGYVVICIDRVFYKGHRLAWLYMMEQWPRAQVDHKNRVKSDNRWANLREANRSQNGANRERYANNKSGLKGVYWHKGVKRWCAQIRVAGTVKHLGSFGTKAEAGEAYRIAAMTEHGDFAYKQ